MPKLKGPLKLKGTLGDITFSKSEDGYIVHEKTSMNGKRIATDPSFQRTRENNAEFGRAGKATKLFRSAIRTLLQTAKDSKVTSRLTGEMMRVLKADTVNPRGMRNVVNGELEFLQGFEFNINAKLSATFGAPFTVAVNRAAGTLFINIPAFVPALQVVTPPGATHFKLLSLAAEVDFAKETYVISTNESAALPWDSKDTADISLVNTVTANSTLPLFLLFSTQFFQQVNGVNYPLKSGAFNALSLVKVSKS